MHRFSWFVMWKLDCPPFLQKSHQYRRTRFDFMAQDRTRKLFSAQAHSLLTSALYVARTVDMKNLEPHPASQIFPLLEGAEFDALMEDLRTHGQRNPIVLCDGMILDGRNRYRAMLALGLAPKFVHWTSGNLEAYVISQNIMRRHLTPAQRAMIVAALPTLDAGHVKAQKQQVSDGVGKPTPLSLQEAADLAGVHRTTVAEAKVILNKGTDNLIAAVKSGAVGMSRAVEEIRAEQHPNKKKYKQRKDTDKDASRIQTLKRHGNIWQDLKQALLLLTGLPQPAEVVAIARIADAKAKPGIINTKLAPARDWLREFEDEWNRNSNDDA